MGLYRFKSTVARSLFDATAQVWREEITSNPANTIGSYYDGRLKQCDQAVDGKGFADGGGSLCAVVKDGHAHADALIVVTYAQAQHLKMLDVTVRPSLNAADRDPSVADLAWIAATAIVGCLGMTYERYPCSELKVFASWPLDKAFLTAITTAMVGVEEFGALYAVTTHGSWIVLTKRVCETV